MNALRSGPFLPVACFAHNRILSCCEIFTGSAAAVAATVTLAARVDVRCVVR